MRSATSGGRSGERLISGVAHLGQAVPSHLRYRFGLQASDRPDDRRLGTALLPGLGAPASAWASAPQMEGGCHGCASDSVVVCVPSGIRQRRLHFLPEVARPRSFPSRASRIFTLPHYAFCTTPCPMYTANTNREPTLWSADIGASAYFSVPRAPGCALTLSTGLQFSTHFLVHNLSLLRVCHAMLPCHAAMPCCHAPPCRSGPVSCWLFLDDDEWARGCMFWTGRTRPLDSLTNCVPSACPLLCSASRSR